MTDHRPVGLRTIARVLETTSRQVWAWHDRRRTTGFPEAIAQVHIPQHPGDKRKAPLFDLNEVVDWWVSYHPNKNRGGKAKNRGNLKHGRYSRYEDRKA